MLFDTSELTHLQAVIASVTGFQLPFSVQAAEGAGLVVEWEGAEAAVRAEDTAALCRALFLLSRAVKEGKSA